MSSYNMTAQSHWQIMAAFMGMNLILCIVFAILTKLGNDYHQNELSKKHKNKLSMMASNNQRFLAYFIYLFAALCALQCFFCHYSFAYPPQISQYFCKYGSPICVVLYYASKASLYGFFLERAKLAQGIIKLFPNWLFKYVLPIYIAIYFVTFSTLILVFFRGIAPENISDGAVTSCVMTTPIPWVLSVGAFTDIFNCLLFLYLFIHPLWKGYKATAAAFSNQWKKKNFLNMMYLNIILSLFCTISSFIVMFVLPLIAQYIWFAGNIDMMINGICVFFMMASNRRYISIKCCGCGKSKISSYGSLKSTQSTKSSNSCACDTVSSVQLSNAHSNTSATISSVPPEIDDNQEDTETQNRAENIV
mmetsp:Transcript_21493/g.18944  ORF Transcript_21493/g.18944 Transcript_21493/m.18944 type:complete len:362 (+) Transcript_21493:49-1134(+)